MASNWRHTLPEHAGRLASILSGSIAALESEHGAVLPDLRGSKALGLAADFSGQHRASRFETFSFVLFDLEGHADWEQGRRTIRKQLIRDDRRVSFKNLRDNVQWRALNPFLSVAGTLPGVLLTVVVEKSFSPEFIFGEGFRATEFDDLSRFLQWPLGTVLKTIWVVHLASILVASLAAPAQNLLWILDEDEIIEDRERILAFSDAFQAVVSDYLTFDMGGFDVLRADDDIGGREIEDLLSVADLAAGAWTEVYNTVANASPETDLDSLLAQKSDRIRAKTELIASWCTQNSRRKLKYLSGLIRPGDDEFPVYAQFAYPRAPGSQRVEDSCPSH